MSNFLQSSNPTLTDKVFANTHDSMLDSRDVTTMQGVVNKTGILVTIAVVFGAVGYSLLGSMGTSVITIAAVASFVLCLGFGFIMCGKPELARVFGPIYAGVEGIFLGGFTALVDGILKTKGIEAAGGAGLQAFIITLCCVGSMLGLYKAGILRPTRKFKAVIYTATAAIMLTYLVSFIMSIAFGMSMPLISVGAAVSESGTMGLIGLGVNVLILVIASLFLIIDFGRVEEAVTARAPKHMEWYLGFGLLVTLAWIYFEALKLVLRLYMLFGSDD